MKVGGEVPPYFFNDNIFMELIVYDSPEVCICAMDFVNCILSGSGWGKSEEAGDLIDEYDYEG